MKFDINAAPWTTLHDVIFKRYLNTKECIQLSKGGDKEEKLQFQAKVTIIRKIRVHSMKLYKTDALIIIISTFMGQPLC